MRGTGDLNETLRRRPEMASLRLQVFAFVRDYIGRWGGSPSQGEIAHATGASRDRVKKALVRLERAGLLRRAAGIKRGLALGPNAPDSEKTPFCPLHPIPVLDYIEAHDDEPGASEPARQLGEAPSGAGRRGSAAGG